MSKKIITLLLITIISSMLTGCWDSVPLETSFIVTGIGVDISEDNPELLTVTVYGPAVNEEALKPYVSYSGEGKNIAEALRHIQNKTYRYLSISHIRIVLLSEDIAKKGIEKYLDIFTRDHQMKNDMILCVTDKRAVDHFSAEILSDPNVSSVILNLIRTGQLKIDNRNFRLRNVVNNLLQKDNNIVLPYLMLSEDKREITLDNVAIFKKGEMITYLPENDTSTLLLMKDMLKRSMLNLGSTNPQLKKTESTSLVIFPKKRKIDVAVKNNKISMDMHFNIDANLFSLQPLDKLIDEKILKEIEIKGSEKIKTRMISLIDKLQKEYKVDVLNLSEYLRCCEPDFYENIEWSDEFTEINFDISVKIELEGLGIAK